MKIEIEIPDEKYNELSFICNKIKKNVEEKIKQILLDAIDNSEITNF